MIIGFANAYMSSSLEGVKANMTGFIMPLSALVGALFGGPMVEAFGRKTMILSTSLPFMIAWLFIAFANFWTFLIGKIKHVTYHK